MELLKEKFCSIINMMEDNYNICTEMNNVLNQTDNIIKEFFNAYALLGPYEEIVINLLEIITNDKNGWISLFCGDFEFGHSEFYDSYEVVSSNGNIYNLNCVETLWELIHLTE